MAREAKPFTKSIPLNQSTVTLFDPGDATFACTPDEKIDLLLDCELPVYVAWPGQYEQHIFEISTTEERREALKRLLG